MIDFKQFAENILDDLMGKTPISDILLKTKIFAAKRNDKELIKWVTQELEGYEDAPPRYRVLTAGLKVEVFVPFRGTARIEFPTDIIQHKNVSNRLSHIPFHNPISEIENLCSDVEDSPNLHMRVPVAAYSFMKPFLNGEIQDSYQYVSKASVLQIVTTVKSLLIDYLLKISQEEDIDFNSFIKNKPNMIQNNNITAGIVNMGDGTITANGATTVVGDNNVISNDHKESLLKIVEEIDKIASALPDHSDYDGVSSDIKQEIKKEHPDKKFIKRCFQAIPTILGSISSDVIANQLEPYITQALALIM